MIFALSALSLPRPQDSKLAPTEADGQAIANLFKKAGLDEAYNKAAGVVLKEIDDVQLFAANADEVHTDGCSASQLAEKGAAATYKLKKKAYGETMSNLKSVCTKKSKDMLLVEKVETAFTAVDKDLSALLMTPTWGLTAEQAADVLEGSRDEAMLNINLEEKEADAAEGSGKSPCAGARAGMQAAKRAMKASRVAKNLAQKAKSCMCHNTNCPIPPPPPPAPSLPPAVCLSYNYCEYGCFCETNWFTGCPGGTSQQGTCGWAGMGDERCCYYGHNP